jgi:biotin transport system substrate-specific component
MQSTLPVQLGASSDVRGFSHTLPGKVLLTVSASLFVALCAHVSIPLYFTPVPITLQTLAVLLVGLTLGPTLGFSALALYLAEGAMGMPVFSPHGIGGVAQLLGPTAGYLFSYPFAAAAAGAVARTIRSKFPAAIVAGIAASVITLTMGASWLTHFSHATPATGWVIGVAPFLSGEVLKIIAAAGAYATVSRWHRS